MHDGLADSPDRTGDAIVGSALAFLDELGRLVHGAQDQVAAGWPQLLAGPGQEGFKGHAADRCTRPCDDRGFAVFADNVGVNPRRHDAQPLGQ
ncbi:hypothetical protein D9M72_257730 [compost metagenome]